MVTSIDIYAPLKKYFGYDSFRPLQEEIINSVLLKKDVLVIMPTGGGKSICYQIPALTLPGVTLVISPLIALMKDQVDGLKANGVKAAFYNSTQDSGEQQLILNGVKDGSLKLLYVAPESLGYLSEILIEEYVSCVAVDEAHCISSWGHDFRPSYQRLDYLKKKMPNTPFMALTATADKATREDILKQLNITNAQMFLSSFDRPNISIDVRPGQKRIEQIVEFLKLNQDESGIIYCLSRKSSEDLARKLSGKGFNCAAYHAGLNSDERSDVQEDFINDRVKIICATIAFGMGIDKSNVRFVIHYNLPKNIEGYYQEIGRAGRDGLEAQALLFHSFADVMQLMKFAEGTANEELQIAKIDRMQQFAEATSCRRKVLLSYFGEELVEDCGNCDVCSNPPEFFDGTIITQKALSTVYRVKEKQAIGSVVDVLRGARNAHILSNGLDKVKTYGIGKDIAWKEWQHYLVQMINQGLLELAFHENSSLKLTKLSRQVLFDNSPVKLTRLQTKGMLKKAAPKKEVGAKFNQDLFEHLRKYRLQISKENSLPAYLIFSDASLKDMATKLPRTEKAMLDVHGVGTQKMRDYGESFLTEINKFLNDKKSQRHSTVNKTYALYKQGLSVERIAEVRELKDVTILSHLCKSFLDGKAVDLKAFIDNHTLNKIERLKNELGDPKELKPYYEGLNEEVSYGTIRVALTILSKV